MWSSQPSQSRYDVVIVGGGIMGAATAWFLAAEPAFTGRVLVVERDPSYATAATTLTNSCIRQQFSAALNIRMSQFGVAYLRRFREALGGDPAIPEIRLDEVGYLYLAATGAGAAALRRNQATQAAEGVATRLLDRAALAAAFPFLETGDILLASHNPRDEGWFDGGTMFEWWRRKARERGVEFVRAEVTALARMGAEIVAVRLGAGTAVAPGAVVNAAGPRAARVARLAGITVPVEPRRRFSFLFAAAEPLPVALPLVIDPSGVHVRSDGPAAGGRYLAGCAPLDDRAAAPDDFSWEDGVFEERVWPALAARIPAFERLRLLRSWVGHYEYNPIDRNAVIGPDPEVRNFIHLSGFSGHGLQHAAAAGRGVAEYLTWGTYRSLDLRPLGYGRIVAGLPFREEAII